MSWLRIRELVRKEFIQLFRDKKNRPLLVIAPLVQLIVFGVCGHHRCEGHPAWAVRWIPHRGKPPADRCDQRQ